MNSYDYGWIIKANTPYLDLKEKHYVFLGLDVLEGFWRSEAKLSEQKDCFISNVFEKKGENIFWLTQSRDNNYQQVTLSIYM